MTLDTLRTLLEGALASSTSSDTPPNDHTSPTPSPKTIASAKSTRQHQTLVEGFKNSITIKRMLGYLAPPQPCNEPLALSEEQVGLGHSHEQDCRHGKDPTLLPQLQYPPRPTPTEAMAPLELVHLTLDQLMRCPRLVTVFFLYLCKTERCVLHLIQAL
jgi:hypothetical protein